MRIRQRSWARLVLVLVLWIAPAASAQSGLEELLLSDLGLAGFEIAPASSGLPNGRVDPSQLESLLPSDVDKPPKELFREIDVVARSWANGRGSIALIFLYRMPTQSAAEEFFGGFARAAEKSERLAESFAVPSVPGAIGQALVEQGQRFEQVAFGRDRVIAQIGVLVGENVGRPEVIQVAERQASRLPGSPTAQGEEESAAFRIGRALGALVPIALVGGIIFWLVTRRRRAAVALPNVPPGPPPIPPSEPPAPPSENGDPPPGTPSS